MNTDLNLVTRLQKLKKLERLLGGVKEKTARMGGVAFGWKEEDYPQIARDLIAAMDEVPGKYREVQ